MHNILIVEDDKDIQETLEFFLKDNGYMTDKASNGIEAIDKFETNKFDLILLDIMLPKVDGYAVCENIRKKSQIPIIIISALSSEENQIKGLDLQADDYIIKPFSIPILLRKISAIFRRNKYNEEIGVLIYKNVKLDLDSYKAFVSDKEVMLTKREFEILHELILNQGKILTREILMERVWQYEYIGNARIVDNHIKNIRKKIGDDVIKTIRGVGYKVDKIY